MKKISDLLSNTNIAEYREKVQVESSLSEEAKEMVQSLFDILSTHVTYFQLNYNKQHEDYLATKREWVKTFQERGTTKNEIQMGVAKLRRITEPLKNITPAEFLAMCKQSPEDLGLPPVEQAYLEAIHNYGVAKSNPRWSHEVVRHAAHHCSSYELMNRSKKESYALFEHNYHISTKMFISGELKEIPKALTADDHVEVAKQQATVKEEFKGVRNASDALKAIKGMLRYS